MKLTVILILAFFACEGGVGASGEALPLGVWGGKGAQVTVTADGVSIDYGCDSGRIDQRPKTDSSGRFSAQGTHTFGSGGPRDPNDPAPKAPKAAYSGVRSGDVLKFSVSLPDLNRAYGNFTVTRGQRAVLERCG